jgi:RNA polymerase sigma factor (sigma-70 family)
MARSMKVKDPATSMDAEGSPAESEAGTGIGVTTSGVRERAGSGTPGDSTAQILAIHKSLKEQLRIYLLKLGVPADDHEEVTQRMMVALLRQVKKDGPPEKPLGYIFRVAETAALRFLGERRRHPLLPDDDAALEVAAPSSRQGLAQQMLRAERMQRIGEGFAKLPPADAAILTMVFDELPQAEVAEKLGISLDAANARYRRALEKLKKLVRCHCTEDDLGGAA